ncbi:MAG: HPF/RaiA family ribosome-associated protein [Ferruginibacter sp.]
MQILIQSPNTTPTDVLMKFIKNKIAKLLHFDDSIQAAEVLLEIEGSDSIDNKVCEIRFVIPGNDLFAKKRSSTFEDAVTQATETLQEEVNKIKSIFQHQ